MLVDGVGSQFNAANAEILVGAGGGTGSLVLDHSATLSAGLLELGSFGSGSLGSAEITDASSLLNISRGISVGGEFIVAPDSFASFLDFGQVRSGGGEIAGGTGSGRASARVSGSGATWTMNGDLRVGRLQTTPTGFTDSELSIDLSARVSDGNASVGCPANSVCVVEVHNSTWETGVTLAVGGDALSGRPSGGGSVSVSGTSQVTVGGDTLLYPGATLSFASGVFTSPTITFVGGGQFQWTGGTLHVGVYHGDLTTPKFGVLAPAQAIRPEASPLLETTRNMPAEGCRLASAGLQPAAAMTWLA